MTDYYAGASTKETTHNHDHLSTSSFSSQELFGFQEESEVDLTDLYDEIDNFDPLAEDSGEEEDKNSSELHDHDEAEEARLESVDEDNGDTNFEKVYPELGFQPNMPVNVIDAVSGSILTGSDNIAATVVDDSAAYLADWSLDFTGTTFPGEDSELTAFHFDDLVTDASGLQKEEKTLGIPTDDAVSFSNEDIMDIDVSLDMKDIQGLETVYKTDNVKITPSTEEGIFKPATDEYMVNKEPSSYDWLSDNKPLSMAIVTEPLSAGGLVNTPPSTKEGMSKAMYSSSEGRLNSCGVGGGSPSTNITGSQSSASPSDNVNQMHIVHTDVDDLQAALTARKKAHKDKVLDQRQKMEPHNHNCASSKDKNPTSEVFRNYMESGSTWLEKYYAPYTTFNGITFRSHFQGHYRDNIVYSYEENMKSSKLGFRRYGRKLLDARGYNYYEPLVFRYHTEDKGFSKHARYGLCPYCMPTQKELDSGGEDFLDDYFFEMNNSSYLHHVTKHHGVYSDGTEMPYPSALGKAREVKDNKTGRVVNVIEVAECPSCYKTIRLSKGDNNTPLLGYYRHLLEHNKSRKNPKHNSNRNGKRGNRKTLRA